jgi:hypothetical protein
MNSLPCPWCKRPPEQETAPVSGWVRFLCSHFPKDACPVNPSTRWRPSAWQANEDWSERMGVPAPLVELTPEELARIPKLDPAAIQAAITLGQRHFLMAMGADQCARFDPPATPPTPAPPRVDPATAAVQAVALARALSKGSVR